VNVCRTLRFSIRLKSVSDEGALKFQRLSAEYVAVGGSPRYEAISRKGTEIDGGRRCYGQMAARLSLRIANHL
jgi:hypothetical protein